MNERIKELAAQAWQYADDNSRDGDNTFGWLYRDKFTELIVQECINILLKPEHAMNHPEELSEYNRGWVNGRLLGIEHIKHRFGVER